MWKENKKKWLCIILLLCVGIAGFVVYEQLHTGEQTPIVKKTQVKKKKKIIKKQVEDVLYTKDITFPQYGEAYAKISCARVGFEKDLYYGDSDAILNIAIGQFPESGFPGQGKPILVAGHNGTHFKQLAYMQAGDIVEITTGYGVYQYQITGSEVMDASAFSQTRLSEKKEELIMYTCYPFDQLNVPQRYFVYAQYLSGKKIVEDAKDSSSS